MEEINTYLLDKFNAGVYLTTDTIKIMTEANEMFCHEYMIHLYDSGIQIPFPQMYIVNIEKLQALSTKINNKCYIVLFNGIFTIHKNYLRTVNRGSLLAKGEMFIDDLLSYTWKFIMLHEYGHLFCSHIQDDTIDSIAQECEADLVATDALIKYIFNSVPADNQQDELIKCFLAIFFFFKDLDMQNESEEYNMCFAYNYYEERNRTHPLNIQRIIYTFQEFNILILDIENRRFSNLKDKILSQLLEIGETQSSGRRIDELWRNANDSIDIMRNRVDEIRRRIPRLGDIQNL